MEDKPNNVVFLHHYFEMQAVDRWSFEERLAENARFIGNLAVKAAERKD